MLPYWLFFIIPALAALAASPRMWLSADGTRPIKMSGLWLLTIVMLSSIIGFRYEVGGDWGSYVRYFEVSRGLSLADLLTLGDPGYWALNMLSNWLGWGVTGVNLLSGLIFAIGLVIFCRSLPRSWLALSCAMPYLVTVVSMGYTRQSVALGLAMIGLTMLAKNRLLAFTMWILLGALFHKTAVLLIPIAGFTLSQNRFLSMAIAASATLIGYFILLQDSAANLINNYTDEKIESTGALIRIIMNVVPGALFLIYRNKIRLAESEKKLWVLLSSLSIAVFFAYFPTSLSTALDRMSLYLIPLQMFVFSHIPDVLGVQGRRNQVIAAGIILYYALVLFIWLNFARNSGYWLPYQMGLA